MSVEQFTMSSDQSAGWYRPCTSACAITALRTARRAELINELANVKLREISPGVIRMDAEAGQHDDRAIALAIAAHDLLNQQASQGGMFLYSASTPAARTARETRHRQCAGFIDRHPDSWHARKLAEWEEVERRKRLARGPAGR